MGQRISGIWANRQVGAEIARSNHEERKPREPSWKMLGAELLSHVGRIVWSHGEAASVGDDLISVEGNVT